MDKTEQDIISGIRDGNEGAFRELVELTKDRIFNTCFGFVHNADDADDLSQEVFIEVFKSINNFNEDSALTTWMYRIAVNKSLDFIKKSKRVKRWTNLTRLFPEENKSDENFFGHNETPQISLEQKERIKILNQAIDTLPNNQKAAFTLHKYEDLSYKEIAEVMKTTVSSVESLMHRAKKNLSLKLEKYYR